MAASDPAVIAAFIAAAVRNANGTISDADLVKAVAISGRESGFDNAVPINDNPSTGDLSAGWFQVNFLKDPNRFKSAGVESPAAVQRDPWQSVKAFAQLFNGSGFFAWGPYKGVSELSGVSAKDLAAAQKGVADARSKGYLDGYVQGKIISDGGFRQQMIQNSYGGSWLDALGGIAGLPGDAVDVAGQAASTASDAIAGPFSSVAGLISALGRTLFNPAWWKWIGIGGLGLLLIVGAMAYANKDEIASGAKTAAIL